MWIISLSDKSEAKRKSTYLYLQEDMYSDFDITDVDIRFVYKIVTMM